MDSNSAEMHGLAAYVAVATILEELENLHPTFKKTVIQKAAAAMDAAGGAGNAPHIKALLLKFLA